MNASEPHRVRRERTDLGLELLTIAAVPGVGLTCHDIAAWAGTSRGRVHQIQEAGLLKLRRHLIRAYGGIRGREIVDQLRAHARASDERSGFRYAGPTSGRAA